MKLLILIVVMVLERNWDALARWCADRAVEKRVLSLKQRLAETLGSTAGLFITWLLPPLLLAWLLSLFDHGSGSLLGVLGYVLIAIATLLLLVAPGKAHQHAHALAQACQQEDATQAAQCRAQLLGDTDDSRAASTPQQLAERIIMLGFHEWFAVLFWFVLFGPAGALFYRLADWLAEPAGTDTTAPNLPARVQALLDWPVARIYAALLLLAGGFNRGLAAWLDGYAEHKATLAEQNAALIGRVGHAALELEREDDCAEGEACLADQSRWYKNAAALALRALLIGFGVVAALTLSGWLD